MGRQYCCVCSNYRGKTVEDHAISLHRFPADKRLRRIWIQRTNLVRKKFIYNKHRLMCSQHFVGLSGPTIENPLPSIFAKKTFKLSTIKSEESLRPNVKPNAVGLPVPTLVEDDTTEVDNQLAFTCSAECSFLKKSVLLHDYCGEINPGTISSIVNKSVQTSEHLKTRSVSVQCTSTKPPFRYNTSTQTTEITHKDNFTQRTGPDLTYEDIRGDNQKLLFYTGIPDSYTFDALFDQVKEDAVARTARRTTQGEFEPGRPRQLRLMDEFFLTLMRMKLGLLLEDLADRFHIGKSTCGDIYKKWVEYLKTDHLEIFRMLARGRVDSRLKP